MRKLSIILALLMIMTLLLIGCGSAKKKLQEKTAEQIAEQLIEQTSGGEVDIDLENNSIKVKDEDGSSLNINNGDKVDLKTFSAVGFEIPLPKGVSDGEVSRFAENDKETGATGTYTTDGSLSRKELFKELDKALTAHGFAFIDPLDPDAKEPDFSDPQPGDQYMYHKEGFTFFFASYADNQFVISGMIE